MRSPTQYVSFNFAGSDRLCPARRASTSPCTETIVAIGESHADAARHDRGFGDSVTAVTPETTISRNDRIVMKSSRPCRKGIRLFLLQHNGSVPWLAGR